jgi:threonine aldolase
MSTRIDFRSDTVTRPTPAMRDAMLSAQVGDDVFGDDPTVLELQAEAAQMLGFEAALFVPSGTQANLIAMMTQCARGEEAILGQHSHAYRWESGGMAVLGSIHPQPLENRPDGTIDLAQVAAAIKPDDPHFAHTRLFGLENTIGGKVLPLDYLQTAGALCQRYGLIAHLDGARLMNAAVQTAWTERPIRDTHTPTTKDSAADCAADSSAPDAAAIRAAAKAICAPFDSVSLCLSKGLGAPVGSLLLGGREVIARGVRIRKMLGGGMRQVGILAAAGRYALAHHLERLTLDHRNAERLAEGFKTLAARPGALAHRLAVEPAQTNMVFVTVDAAIAPALAAHLRSQGVGCSGATLVDGSIRQRWVTHLDVDAADVDETLEILAKFSARAA